MNLHLLTHTALNTSKVQLKVNLHVRKKVCIMSVSQVHAEQTLSVFDVYLNNFFLNPGRLVFGPTLIGYFQFSCCF